MTGWAILSRLHRLLAILAADDRRGGLHRRFGVVRLGAQRVPSDSRPRGAGGWRCGGAGIEDCRGFQKRSKASLESTFGSRLFFQTASVHKWRQLGILLLRLGVPAAFLLFSYHDDTANAV